MHGEIRKLFLKLYPAPIWPNLNANLTTWDGKDLSTLFKVRLRWKDTAVRLKIE